MTLFEVSRILHVLKNLALFVSYLVQLSSNKLKSHLRHEERDEHTCSNKLKSHLSGSNLVMKTVSHRINLNLGDFIPNMYFEVLRQLKEINDYLAV